MPYALGLLGLIRGITFKMDMFLPLIKTQVFFLFIVNIPLKVYVNIQYGN